MRVIAAIGSVVFAYLAIIPAGLVVSTIDPACAGSECETGLARDIPLTVGYIAAFLALGGTSAALSLYAFRPSVGGERWIRRLLAASLLAVGASLGVLFAIAEPLPAAVTLAIGGCTYAALSRGIRRSRFDPARNGHARVNGHPG